MKKLSTIAAVCIALALGVVSLSTAAEDVTLKGTIMCAKCSLKKADAKGCQDVLVTEDDGGTTTEYYIASNEVSKKFGHNCSGKSAATVTGVVSEQDGRKWIAPTKMEKAS